jgi:acid phosphatase family membrane protein YuiD
MLEHSRRSEAFRTGRPLVVGAVTVVAIERTVSHADRGGTHAWFSIALEPYALIVRDAAGIRALGTGEVAVSIEQLRHSVPELDALLASI